MLKFTQSGRVFLKTAFANTEKGIDAWIEQNKSSQALTAKIPRLPGQLLENSQTCRTGVQRTQRIFCLYYIKITGNRQENGNP